MLEINCSGSPYEIGHVHGTSAAPLIHRSIAFYQRLFAKNASMPWPAVLTFAQRFIPFLKQHYPAYLEEMSGIAAGADLKLEDILALNVRTEISFGAFSDGCTAFAVKEGYTRGPDDGGKSWLAQNWDWDVEQGENLVLLRIEKDRVHGTAGEKIKIALITEAGIIGKIGLNNYGVGVTLNAIKARGVSWGKLPCHLALRTVLECTSMEEAVRILEERGVASACHITVADGSGATGLECSSEDVVSLEIDGMRGWNGWGMVAHTNHFMGVHTEGVVEANGWIQDTEFRLERVRGLLGESLEKGEWGWEKAKMVLKDEKEGDGASICRRTSEKSQIGTLFGIVMCLSGRVGARVSVGRPVEAKEEFEIVF